MRETSGQGRTGEGAFPVERHERDCVLYDYTMRPYRPPGSTAGRMKSANLLYHLLETSPMRDRYRRLLDGVRSALGTDRTVWGVKLDGGRLLFELYFYFRSLTSASSAPEMRAAIVPPITHAQVYDALRGTLEIVTAYPDHVPAIMMSVDVDDRVLEKGSTDLVHLYLMSGLSYDLGPGGLEHKNHYLFFETSEPDRLRAMVAHLSNGMAHGSAAAQCLHKVLVPALYSCRTICLAVKSKADAVYFSGVRTSQLLWLLREHGWPATAIAFLESSQEDFSHVLWDVGIDFTAPGGEVRTHKTGIYGTL